MREQIRHNWVGRSTAHTPQQVRTLAIIFISIMALAVLLGPSIAKSETHAKVVSGPARIVDGDTIEVAGERIRLEGIDTPEPGQTCPRKWVGTWKCGRAATRALNKLIAGRTVRCESTGRGERDRLIGKCFVNGQDINAHMVSNGYAWAFVKYSTSYVAEENTARAAKLGIWSGPKAQPAWEYRRRHWARAEQVAPEGCAIKGNISASGKHIYHPPWSPWYHKVIIDASKGERWFCSESDAKSAGWRAAGGH